jgi:hypothetical protein
VNEPLRAALLADPPKFHYWGDRWRPGGIDPPLLELLERAIAATRITRGVARETGAGLSSAWLLCLGFAQVHSHCIDPAVCGRVSDYLQQYPDERARWQCHIGPSALTLPQAATALSTPLADFCLIDGGHGLDNVFTDFVYLNYMLRRGGLLVLDDLQLGSCRLLHEWLTQPNMGYTCVDRTPKLAVLRKETDLRLMRDFGSHLPFLQRLSGWLGDPQ